MKLNFSKFVLLVFIGAVVMTACGKDKKGDPTPNPEADTVKPVIVTEIPLNNATFALGQSINYNGTFTDNVDLKQVTFSLSDKKAATLASLKSDSSIDVDPWGPADVTVKLTGKSQIVVQELFGKIPAGIWQGTYTLKIKCSDKADNITYAEIDLTIQ